MRDLKSPSAIWLKGGLFLTLGTASAVLLLVEAPSLKVAVLLAVSIWAFCRAYYFAFYVIEHYLNPNYRFSGLISVVRFLVSRRIDKK
jgi:hypothetical protein